MTESRWASIARRAAGGLVCGEGIIEGPVLIEGQRVPARRGEKAPYPVDVGARGFDHGAHPVKAKARDERLMEGKVEGVEAGAVAGVGGHLPAPTGLPAALRAPPRADSFGRNLGHRGLQGPSDQHRFGDLLEADQRRPGAPLRQNLDQAFRRQPSQRLGDRKARYSSQWHTSPLSMNSPGAKSSWTIAVRRIFSTRLVVSPLGPALELRQKGIVLALSITCVIVAC